MCLQYSFALYIYSTPRTVYSINYIQMTPFFNPFLLGCIYSILSDFNVLYFYEDNLWWIYAQPVYLVIMVPLCHSHWFNTSLDINVSKDSYCFWGNLRPLQGIVYEFHS